MEGFEGMQQDEDDNEQMDIDEENEIEPDDESQNEEEHEILDDSIAEDINEDTNQEDQPTHSKKHGRKISEELIIRQKEKDSNLNTYLENPISVDDFEKLILSDFNNSVNWIKYASYILDKMNLSSSRKIFERAIKAIDIANLKEKLNVWIAFINLEYTYGDNNSYQSCVERALEINDKKSIYKHLITIYSQSNKFELALEIYKLCLKSYFGDLELWKKFLEFLFEAQKAGALSQNTDFMSPKEGLNRAIQIVPKSKNIDVN